LVMISLILSISEAKVGKNPKNSKSFVLKIHKDSHFYLSIVLWLGKY
jgi:hypothetical protein